MLRGMPARSNSPVSAPRTAPAPVSVIVGEEELLVERSVNALVTAGRLALAAGAGLAADEGTGPGDPATAPGDIHDVAAKDLAVVVIRSAQDAGKDVADEIVRYAAVPAPDMFLVLTHAGGAKGKALLTSLTQAGQPAGIVTVIECPKITRFSDRLDFVRAEFRRAGRVADEGGLRALLDAVGSDLREIAAACSQLAADVEGHIGEESVARYYHGRAEASGFTVSDRAVEGRLVDALEQLRWALSTGVPPVLITSALALGVRLLGRVGAAPRG